VERYKLIVRSGHEFDIDDCKYGHNIVATFRNLDAAQQYIEYVNWRENGVRLVLKHVSEDIEEEFKS
jgi:hypothetical protein